MISVPMEKGENMKGTSKFEYSAFMDDCGMFRWFAVSKQKYTQEEAYEIFERETDERAANCRIPDCAVVWRAGIVDGERYVSWWLELDATGTEPRHCPVWAFEY